MYFLKMFLDGQNFAFLHSPCDRIGVTQFAQQALVKLQQNWASSHLNYYHLCPKETRLTVVYNRLSLVG